MSNNKKINPSSSDILGSLAGIAEALRNKSRKKKIDPVKQSLINKGFDPDKEKRKAKYRNSSSYRYPLRLQQINDARAEAARKKRLTNPDLKAINEETIKIAQERVKQQKKSIYLRQERERYAKRPCKSFYLTGRPYGELDDEFFIEVTPTTHTNRPTFKNKIEEHIFILKNKKF